MLRILIFVIVVLVLVISIPRLLSRSTPSAGSAAPDFTLPSADGSQVSLKNYRGKWVVLYFYPKDQTPG